MLTNVQVWAVILTLPVVILRSAVDTMVDTVFPLTSAVKVALKTNSNYS